MYIKEELKPGYTGRFVIHDHEASHHHWDLRLEFPVTSVSEALGTYGEKRPPGKSPEPAGARGKGSGTVFRSWAIPKHRTPTNKPVLATETENHALEYGSFKGTIPEGEYGAGTVDIHDRGTFKLLDADYDKKYVFELRGKKIHGSYALIKTGGKSFIWVKVKDTSKYKLSTVLRILASAIDYPRPFMIDAIWDQGTNPVKMREKVKKDVLNKMSKSLKKCGIKESQISGVYIDGSASGYNYKEDGDFDVLVTYTPGCIKDPLKTQKTLDENRSTKVPGTDLTYSFMLKPEGDPPRSDGVYDVLNNLWVQGPTKIPENFDPDLAFQKEKRQAKHIMHTIYAIISDIQSTLKDLKRIDQYNEEYGNKLSAKRVRVLSELSRLCQELIQWRSRVWALQARVSPQKIQYPAFNFSHDWNSRYITFKYIARYGGHEPVYYLYNLLQDSPYLKLVKDFMPENAIGRLLKNKP